MNNQTTKYALPLRILHWLLAVMLIMTLFMGFTQLSAIPNANPEKIAALRAHMTIGLGIGGLMLIRLLIRLISKKPPTASTGHQLLDMAGKATHWLFYILVFLMVASGIGIAAMADLPAIIFQGQGSLPTDFSAFPPRIAHGIIASLLLGLIVLHIAAAIYHQFIRKDRLFSRMWFGKS